MKKCIILLLLFFIYKTWAFAQQEEFAYRIYFKDKNDTQLSLNQPEEFLSPKAIQRRIKYNIEIDSTDLPIPQNYVNQLLSVTNGSLICTSKWHNTAVVLLNDTSVIQDLLALEYILSAKLVAYDPISIIALNIPNPPNYDTQAHRPLNLDNSFYGSAWEQIHLCEGEFLHEHGFWGETINIAVIDAGFDGINTISAFDSMRNNNRIIDHWNYVNNSGNLNGSSHGTQVLSIMAAFTPEAFVGTAPKANYALYVTDHHFSEQTIEEDYWTAAAERADSIGIDLINSSLGYNKFDQWENNYEYADLNGHSTFLAKTANWASRKGIMTIVSAGNEAENMWYYLLTPGDAELAFTVGSVTAGGMPALTSSNGPNADLKIKPDISALGQGAMTINSNGVIVAGNGTSLATPIISGLTACFMQAYPNFPPQIIQEKIRAISSNFSTPDNKIGYGIPDFRKLLEDEVGIKSNPEKTNIIIYPNPAEDMLYIDFGTPKTAYLEVLNEEGKTVQNHQMLKDNVLLKLNIHSLSSGIYFLKISMENSQFSTKFIIK